jgi:hypothetical protein
LITEKERTIQLIVAGQNITLKLVDTNEQRSAANIMGQQQYLNAGDEPLYVGGVPNSIRDRITRNLAHVRNSSSFAGCLLNLHLNQQQRALQRVEYSHKIEPGCSSLDACSNSKCQNGAACKSTIDNGLHTDYVCACPREFTGVYCEQALVEPHHRAVPLLGNYNSNGQMSALILKSADDEAKQSKVITFVPISADTRPQLQQPQSKQQQQQQQPQKESTCGERVVHEFYTDSISGCRTKKRIRMIRCAGECEKQTPATNKSVQFNYLIGANRKSAQRSLTSQFEPREQQQQLQQQSLCCEAHKSKARKIRLYCADGSTVKADISIIRKCMCTNKCNSGRV